MKQKPSTRILSAFMAIVMVFLMIPASIFSAFAQEPVDESAEENVERLEPSCTLIYTADDLNRIRENLSGTYILMNDIDLSSYENWMPIGSVDAPFTGDLLGAGYTISGMQITNLPEAAEDGYAYIGLFGYNQGMIRDVIVEGTVSAELAENEKAYVGSLVGYNDGKVLNCRDGVTHHDYALSKNTLYTGTYKLSSSSTTNITLGKQYAAYLSGTGAVNLTIENGELSALYIFLRDANVTGLNLSSNTTKDIYIISQGTSNVINAKNDCRAIDLPNAKVTIFGNAPLTINGEHGENGANGASAGAAGGNGTNAIEPVKVNCLVVGMENDAILTIVGGNGGKGGDGARGTHYTYNSPNSSSENGAKGPDGGNGGAGGRGGNGASAIFAESIIAISSLYITSGNGGQGGQGGRGGDGAKGNKGTPGKGNIWPFEAYDGGTGGTGGNGGYAGDGGDGGNTALSISNTTAIVVGIVCIKVGDVGARGASNNGGYRGDGGNGGSDGGTRSEAGGGGSSGTNRTGVYSSPGALGKSPVSWKTQTIDTINGVQTTTDASGIPTTEEISVVIPDATIKVYGYATPNAQAAWNKSNGLLQSSWSPSEIESNARITRDGNAIYYGSATNPHAILIDTISNSVSSCTVHPDTEYIYSFAFTEYTRSDDDKDLFDGCNKLTAITIPANVYGIGQYAFAGCSALTRFISSQPIDDIGAKAFLDCSNLKEIILVDHPDKMRIGDGTFRNCASLTSIDLPQGIESIEQNTFVGAKKLKQIEIPAAVTVIGANAFDGCAQLQTVTFENGSQLTTIGSAAFSGCSSLQAVTFPDGLESIGANAFKENTSMTSLHIPAAVNSIGNDAFYACSALIVITVDEANENYVAKFNTLIEKANNQAILGCVNSNLRDAGVTSVKSGAFVNIHFIKPFEIPETVSLESGAIAGCNGEIILLHTSLEQLGSRTALIGCEKAKIYAYETLNYVDDNGETIHIGSLDAKVITNGKAGDNAYYIVSTADENVGGGKSEVKMLIYGYGSTYNYQQQDVPLSSKVNPNLGAYNLYYIVVSDGVEGIGAETFCGFPNVVSIQLGKDIKKIDAKAFDVVTKSSGSLKNISFAGDFPEMDRDAIVITLSPDKKDILSLNNLIISHDADAHGWVYNGKPYVCFIPGVGFSTEFPEEGVVYHRLESSNDLSYINTAGYDQYGIHYVVTDENKREVAIDSYSPVLNTPTEIRVPSKVMISGKEYTVVAINENAFINATVFETIIVNTDNGISSVKSGAFIDCTAQVYLVGNPIEVDENAFDEGTCVIVDQSTSGWEDKIKNATLYYTNILTGYQDQNGIYYTIDLDAGTAIVGKKSNVDDESLINTSGATAEEVVIPDFVTYNDHLYKVVGFDRYAFFGNQTAKTIKFGVFIGEGQSEDVPAIWDCTFRNVNNLTAIITENNPYYLTEDGVLYGSPLIPEGEEVVFARLIKYPDKKNNSEFEICEGVTVIENYAFAGNSNLQSIDITTVNVVGSHAFWNCTSLVELQGNYQLHDVGDSAFENTSIKLFKFGESLSTIGVRAFYGSKLEGNININDNITYIGESAFGRCDEIKSFAFCDYSDPDEPIKTQSVSGIYKVDFANADATGYALLFECLPGYNTLLQFAASFEQSEVDMTASERIVPNAIETEAFRGAKYVEKIVMNDATVEVGSEAFANCRRLEYVKLGASYFGSNKDDDIGGIYSYNLFIDCPALEYIEVHEKNEKFLNDSNGVLYSREKDVLYCYPAGIQRVNYKVPATVTKIYDSAFYGNTSLKQVVVGTTQQLSIGSRAFGNCTNLTAVYYATETVPTVGEKIYDNTPKSLYTRFKAEFADAGWSQYASSENEKAKIWCERSADEYEFIAEVPNDFIKTNDYLIFIKNTSVEALNDVYVIVTVYAVEKINDNEVIIPHKFYLTTDENGRINFSTAEIEGKPIAIAPYIHIYAQKDGYYTYDQDLYLDTEMLISYLTMTMEPDVFGVSCEDVDINSQTADLNLALYHEHVSYTVQNGNDSAVVERIDYRDVAIKVLGFWDPVCTNPEFTLIQSGKVLPTRTYIDGNNCTFVISAEAFFDANGIVNEDPIEVRVTVQNGDKGTLECRKVLNINVMDFEINEEDINLDFEADISLEEGPDIFKQLFGSAGFQFKLGEDVDFKTMIKGSQVILTLTAETPDPEKDPEAGYKKYAQPHDKGSYFFQYYDGLLTYNIRFVKSDKDHYFYYRLYVYFGAPGVSYNDSLMEEKALYGAVNLSPYEAKLEGREKVRLRSLSIFMETKKWITDTFIPEEGCFDLDRFGEKGLKDFEPPCDGYVPMNQSGTAQVQNKHSFKAGIEGELVFEYAKGEGLHLASGSVKGYLKYTFKHNSQYVVWVIPVTLEVEVSVSGEIFLKLRFDDPETPIALQELSAKLSAEIQASVGIGCSVASVGIYGNIGTVIIFDILPDPGIREWEIHGEFGAYIKMFWYKQNFKIWSGKHEIIKQQSNEESVTMLHAARAKMFLASTYRYSPDCDENAQIVKINGKYYKFYFTPVTESGYDAYNCIKLVYSTWETNGWSNYTIVEDNGKADAAYTILEDETGVYLAYTQQTKLMTAETINDTTAGAKDLSLKWINLSSGVEAMKAETIVNGEINSNYKYAMQIGVVKGSPVVVWAENSDNNIFGVSPDNYYDDITKTSHVYQTSANSIQIARCQEDGSWTLETLADGLSSVMDIAVNNDAVYYIVDLDGDLTDSSDCTLKSLTHGSSVSTDIAAANSVENHNGQIFYYGTNLITEGLHTVTGTSNLPTQTTMLNNGYVALMNEDGISALLYVEPKSWKDGENTLSCSVIKGIFREGDTWGDPVVVYDPEMADCYIASFDAEMINNQMRLALQLCDGNGNTLPSESIDIDVNETRFNCTYEIDYINRKVICQVTNLGTKTETFSVNNLRENIVSGKCETFEIPFGTNTSVTLTITAEGKQISEQITLNTAYVDLKPMVKQMVVGEQNSLLIAIRNNGNNDLSTPDNKETVRFYVFSGAVSDNNFPANNESEIEKWLAQNHAIPVVIKQKIQANGIIYYELILDDSMLQDGSGILSLYAVAAIDGSEPEMCLTDNLTAIYLSEIMQTVDGTINSAETMTPEASLEIDTFDKFTDGSISADVEITVIADPSVTVKVTVTNADQEVVYEFVDQPDPEQENVVVSYLRRIKLPTSQLNTLADGTYQINVTIPFCEKEKLYTFDLTIRTMDSLSSYVNVEWYDSDNVFLNGILVHKEDIPEEFSADVIPTPPAKEGYTFLRWDKKTDEANNKIIYTAVYEQNVIAEKESFSITWVIHDTLRLVRTVEEGMLPIAPERVYLGQIIRGWDCNSDGKADALTEVNGDVTYVALFDQSAYELELNGSAELGMMLEVNLSNLPFSSDANRVGKLKYQWYLDGEAIKGATTSSYELSAQEYGKVIWVLVWDADWIGTSREFVVAKHPHSVFHNAYQAPTCEHNGTIEYWYCHSCNAYFSDVDCTESIKPEDIVILATNHQYLPIVTLPTCLAEGYTTHTCKNCQHTYVDSKVEKTDHAMSDWTQTQAPTCVADGIERRDCANCDHFEVQTIAKLGHDFAETWTVDVAATCTNAGSESRHCSRCDATTEAREITKLAHEYNAGEITVEATAASIGIKTFICENCDYSYTEELPKVAPQIIEQDKDVWKEWTGDEAIAFRSNASYEDFIEVRINGEILSTEFYTLREGSIVVELKTEYLNALQNGNYQLEIVSQGGVATTDFSVSKNVIENPWVLWGGISVLSIGLLSFGIWLVFFKKKWLVLRSKV